MEILFDLILFLFNWRLSISVASSLILVVVLSSLLPWFTGGYCITLVILATAFGTLWQGRATNGFTLTQRPASPSISMPVAFLGFTVLGFLWGGLFAYLLNSTELAAVALLISVVLIGCWCRYILNQNVTLSYLLFAAISLFLGYAGIFLLKAGTL